jgi:hypothetical protein
MNDDDDYEYDYVTFEGPCTCEHKPEKHGWEKCDIPDCNCEAHWEE